MALLKIFKNGELVTEMSLVADRTYTFGRGEMCDYKLDGEPGISRQHFRVANIEGAWKVLVLSRYGEVYMNETQTADFYLSEGIEFVVPPYSFIFLEQEKEIQQELADDQPHFSDRTAIMKLGPEAQLCLRDPKGSMLEKFILNGDQWIAGRDPVCEIHIDRPRFSRKHFEVKKFESNYFIRDLGSSNGTVVNGKIVESTDWTHLQSGDSIQIADWKIEFNIIDADFEKRLQSVDPLLRLPAVTEIKQIPTASYGLPSFPPPVVRSQSRNWVRLLSLALIAGGVMYYAFDQNEKPKQVTENKVSSPLNKLTPDQQNFVKQTYGAGRQLFMQGKYELARQEMISLHQVIPQYEDSKQIQEMASQALATIEEQRRLEMKEKDKREIEEKIQKQVAVCRAQLGEDAGQIENCLAPIVQFNPDHPAIVSLKADAERIVTEKKIREANQAEYKEKIRKQRALFAAAEKLKKSEPLQAIKAFEKVIGSPYPDPNGLKSEAKRQIASIQQNVSDRQAELDQKAETARKAGKWKEAVLALQSALKINPDNEVIRGRIDTVMNDLRKQMQVLYQEGILEESVGEVDSARVRWKKIIDQSVPEEEYYKKARSKLKKYGDL